MARLVRHRRTKGAGTDRPDLNVAGAGKGRTLGQGSRAMSSREEQRHQKTLEGGFPQEEAVNPPGPSGAPRHKTTSNPTESGRGPTEGGC